MATVYRGRHNTLNRDVAIKVLHPHLSSSTRNRKRFAREARAIEHLRHDNILQIFDYSGLDTSDCYIITEFVEGETLSAVLAERGKLPSEVAALIGLHLARALDYAHSENILHRDLKPDNVMIRADGTVKLMDFGIARFLDESQVTMTGALVGSPAFMSPEQAKEEVLDQRSDLFSLGTVLFFLVTGYLPFTGSNPSLILKNVIESNRPHVAELAPAMSAGFADVVERLMAGAPDDRYATAADVAGALEQCLDEVGVYGDPSFGLSTYIENPDAYEIRLDGYLQEVLMERGKALLERGDHLQALRLFNRLLSLDEDNEEVLGIVQGLHTSESSTSGRGRAVVAASLAVLLIGSGLYTIFANWDELGRTAPPEPEPAIVEPTPAPAPPAIPAAPAPELAPAPLAEPSAQPAPVPTLPAPRAPVARPQVVLERPVPRLAQPVMPPPVEEYGRVKITSGEMPADVWLGDRKLGSTRNAEPIAVVVGTHELTVKSPFTLPRTIKVTIGPGETVTKTVHLDPTPATVTFDPSYALTCRVAIDGRSVATLRELGGSLEVPRPNKPHTIRVDCPTGSREKAYKFLPTRTVFPALE